MKKSLSLIMFLFLIVLNYIAIAQSNDKTIELLYFKANLACCKARACNNLQADVESVISNFYPNQNIVFRVVRLADTTNRELIEKYNAKSQTVIILTKIPKKNKELSIDVTDIVHNYSLNRDLDKFFEEMKSKINEALNFK